MKVKAAVAHAAGQPLSIEEIELEGPKEGEVLIEIKATGVCHTDAYTLSGADPEGLFPSVLGHEGAGVVVDVGPGVTTLAKGDHVIPLYVPECRQCSYCTSGKTNLCQAIRATQGKGLMPDGSSRFSAEGGKTLFHYMGTSTFAQYTVVPEIAVAKVREDAPFDKICYIGCGVTTGVGAVINTAKVEPGSNVVVFGLGGIGLNVIQGARMARRQQDRRRRPQPRQAGAGREVRHDPLRQPQRRSSGDLVPYLVDLTGGGADYSFECIGNVECHAPGAGVLPQGLGHLGHHRRGRRRARRSPPAPSSWSPAGSGRAPPSAAPSGRTDVPKIVDWYMDGKINIDDLITHTMPLGEINKAFDLMHHGESIRSVVVF